MFSSLPTYSASSWYNYNQSQTFFLLPAVNSWFPQLCSFIFYSFHKNECLLCCYKSNVSPIQPGWGWIISSEGSFWMPASVFCRKCRDSSKKKKKTGLELGVSVCVPVCLHSISEGFHHWGHVARGKDAWLGAWQSLNPASTWTSRHSCLTGIFSVRSDVSFSWDYSRFWLERKEGANANSRTWCLNN